MQYNTSTVNELSYRKISDISHTKFQNLNVSHFILQLSLPNPLSQVPTTSEWSTNLLPTKAPLILEVWRYTLWWTGDVLLIYSVTFAWLMKNILHKAPWCVHTVGQNARRLSNLLTHKQLKIHGCILDAVGTDALVLKHQAISTHSAD